MVAVLDSVVAGAVVGIAAHVLDAGTGGSIAIALTLFGFAMWAVRAVAMYRRNIVARFPTPPAESLRARSEPVDPAST